RNPSDGSAHDLRRGSLAGPVHWLPVSEGRSDRSRYYLPSRGHRLGNRRDVDFFDADIYIGTDSAPGGRICRLEFRKQNLTAEPIDLISKIIQRVIQTVDVHLRMVDDSGDVAGGIKTWPLLQ